MEICNNALLRILDICTGLTVYCCAQWSAGRCSLLHGNTGHSQYGRIAIEMLPVSVNCEPRGRRSSELETRDALSALRWRNHMSYHRISTHG
jgi:hypothetical protein